MIHRWKRKTSSHSQQLSNLARPYIKVTNLKKAWECVSGQWPCVQLPVSPKKNFFCHTSQSGNLKLMNYFWNFPLKYFWTMVDHEYLKLQKREITDKVGLLYVLWRYKDEESRLPATSLTASSGKYEHTMSSSWEVGSAIIQTLKRKLHLNFAEWAVGLPL